MFETLGVALMRGPDPTMYYAAGAAIISAAAACWFVMWRLDKRERENNKKHDCGLL